MRAFWKPRPWRLARRTLKSLELVETHLATQNKLLARLADYFAPEIPAGEPAVSGIDFLNEREMGTVIAYIEHTRADLGRDPTEEEILRYLADEATDALHREKQL